MDSEEYQHRVGALSAYVQVGDSPRIGDRIRDRTRAQAEPSQVRDLLAPADPLEPATRTQIADLIKRTLAESDTLPTLETVRRKIKTGQHLTQEITVEQWLTEFLHRKRRIEETIRHSYAGHIRLHLAPYLGRLRLDQLKVSDIALMSEQIEEFNDTITERRADPDPQVRENVKFRRPISIATMHRIRATLRHALSMAMRQDRLIDFNPAAVLEMPAHVQPKPLVWTEDRVRAWQEDFRPYRQAEKQRRGVRRVDPIDAYTSVPRPSPVMVWTPAQTLRLPIITSTQIMTLRGLRKLWSPGRRKCVRQDDRLCCFAWPT